MSASTALEVVRVGASAVGAVFAFLALAAAWVERRAVEGQEPSTRAALFQQRADALGVRGALIRGVVHLVIQLCMFWVAREAYLLPDAGGEISHLSLLSNLNQIGVIAMVTVLSIWDWRDASARREISTMAAFQPPARAARRPKRAEDWPEEDRDA